MSIKIFVAWRVPIRRLNEAADILHQQLFDLSYAHYKDCCARLLKEIQNITATENRTEFWLAMYATDLFRKLMVQRSEWNSTSMECGFFFSLDEDWAYLRPWGAFINHVQPPDWWEDYHCQTSMYDSRQLPEDELERRIATWSRILFEAPVSRQFEHRVIDPNNTERMADLTSRYWAEHNVFGRVRKDDTVASTMPESVTNAKKG